MHTPPWQASPLVQALPSSQGVVSSTAMPVHTPLWQVSPVVQAFPSSHGVLSGRSEERRVGTERGSWLVQDLSKTHAAPSSSAGGPVHVPAWQVSGPVQAF